MIFFYYLSKNEVYKLFRIALLNISNSKDQKRLLEQILNSVKRQNVIALTARFSFLHFCVLRCHLL